MVRWKTKLFLFINDFDKWCSDIYSDVWAIRYLIFIFSSFKLNWVLIQIQIVNISKVISCKPKVDFNVGTKTKKEKFKESQSFSQVNNFNIRLWPEYFVVQSNA